MKKLILKTVLGVTFITFFAINMVQGMEGINFKENNDGGAGGACKHCNCSGGKGSDSCSCGDVWSSCSVSCSSGYYACCTNDNRCHCCPN